MNIETSYEIVDSSDDTAKLIIIVSVNGEQVIKNHVCLSGFSREVVEEFVSGYISWNDLDKIQRR